MLVNETSVSKIGQYPSLADIQFTELGKKYNKVLPKEDLKNFKKAIGFHSHWGGAWSFVYLRRIFENLIFETYQNHKTEISLSETDFKWLRMSEKVETIENFLPSSLLRMKAIYWILSKWVHELSEEECMKYFWVLKISIELILDEKIEIKAKVEKDKKTELEIQRISQQISKS